MSNLIAPTWDDLAECHADAADGDTITVAPGTYATSSHTAISKYVNIVADGVTVTDNTDGLAGDMIAIAESPLGSTKLSGLTVHQGSGIHQNTFGVVAVDYNTNGKPVLVTRVTYTMVSSGGNFFYARTNRGVLWANHGVGHVDGRNCFNNSSFLRHKWTSGGIDAWKKPAKYGMQDTNGDQALYVEGNTINKMLEAVDWDDNARCVFRHNTVINPGLIAHGVDTSGIIGGRYAEIYNNTFVRDTTPQLTCDYDGQHPPVNMNGFIGLRGGTALIHGNVIPNINDGWWGDKGEVSLWYENLGRNSGGYPCWSTRTAPGAGYPAPHNTGWGFTTGGTNPGNLGSDVLQDIEPIYIWNNTGDGNHNAPAVMDWPNECGVPATPHVSEYIKEGREYFLSAKPGYTPYTYPHPLSDGTTAPPIEPPVEPPIEPPIEPPVEPPVEPPIDNTPPTVVVSVPANITKQTTITVKATDEVGVAWMELAINGQVVKSVAPPDDATEHTMTYKFNTNPYRGRTVTLTALARDGGGLVATHQISVFVKK